MYDLHLVLITYNCGNHLKCAEVHLIIQNHNICLRWKLINQYFAQFGFKAIFVLIIFHALSKLYIALCLSLKTAVTLSVFVYCKVSLALMIIIVRLLVATLHVGMTGKQDGGYTQLA